MSELATVDAPTAEVAVAQPASTQAAVSVSHSSRLTEWAQDARQASLVAQSLARTAFVPVSLRGKHADAATADQITVSQITAAILTGQELGLNPMASLRSIDIIEGTPAMRAHALRGVVQAHGHRVWVEETTDTRAIVCGLRAGDDKVQKSVWTIDRAKKQNLTGKTNWQKMPASMLVARATSEVCRWVGGDALLGMPYSSEELADEAGEQFFTVEQLATEATKPVRRTAQRKPVEKAPVAEPEIEEPDADTPLVEGDAVGDDEGLWPDTATAGEPA